MRIGFKNGRTNCYILNYVLPQLNIFANICLFGPICLAYVSSHFKIRAFTYLITLLLAKLHTAQLIIQ